MNAARLTRDSDAPVWPAGDSIFKFKVEGTVAPRLLLDYILDVVVLQVGADS